LNQKRPVVGVRAIKTEETGKEKKRDESRSGKLKRATRKASKKTRARPGFLGKKPGSGNTEAKKRPGRGSFICAKRKGGYVYTAVNYANLNTRGWEWSEKWDDQKWSRNTGCQKRVVQKFGLGEKTFKAYRKKT